LIQFAYTARVIGRQYANYMSEQCLPDSDLDLVEHIHSEKRIDIEAWKAGHEGILGIQLVHRWGFMGHIYLH
jgi:hypothetical protein